MFTKISIDSLTNNIVESLKFILIGQSIDNRIYEINVTIHPQVFKATIELKTPARIPVEQNIPVSNGSNNEAKIKVQFIPAPGENVFSC